MTDIQTESFPAPGLFLLFPDGERLDLTRTSIEFTENLYLNDPQRLSQETRAAVEYEPCAICPQRDTAKICHAVVVVLPFLEDLDRHMSYDEVTAVYREADTGVLHVEVTTLQRALNFLTMLSLLEYCEQGKQFAQYFEDVNPLMPPEQISRQVFRNLYLKQSGDVESIRRMVGRMHDDFHTTTHCQIKRIKLICKNDALLNAFVNLHTVAGWLTVNLQEQLEGLS